MLRKVLLEGAHSLRVNCLPMTFEEVLEKLQAHGEVIDDLLWDMKETMLHAQGVGLAANQIGLEVALFILKDDALTAGYMEYISPTIINAEELVDFENEGCLSVPGVSGTTKRYNKIRLTYQVRNGMFLIEEFTGQKAFAVQHEMDHLSGKLYIDQFGPVRKSMLLKKHKKFVRGQR